MNSQFLSQSQNVFSVEEIRKKGVVVLTVGNYRSDNPSETGRSRYGWQL